MFLSVCLSVCLAVGCVDIATTMDVWAIRQGDHLILRCNQTMEEFHLSCVGQAWIGDFSNCTLPGIHYYTHATHCLLQRLLMQSISVSIFIENRWDPCVYVIAAEC